MSDDKRKIKDLIVRKLHDMVEELAKMPDWVWNGEAFPTLRITWRGADAAITLVVGIEEGEGDEEKR